MKTFLLVIVLLIIALVVGMISPGEWMTNRSHDFKQMYNSTVRFRNTSAAKDFCPNPFELKIVYLKSPDGKLETYLFNAATKEMLPIYLIEGTTQVGDVAHRFKGIGEEGRSTLKTLIESAKTQGTGALDKLLERLGK